jgi:hypothetical protein
MSWEKRTQATVHEAINLDRPAVTAPADSGEDTPHERKRQLRDRQDIHIFIHFKGQSNEIFFASGFFHESVSPKPLSTPLGPFLFFSKIHGDIRSSRCTTGVVETGGKFATSVVDTGGAP